MNPRIPIALTVLAVSIFAVLLALALRSGSEEPSARSATFEGAKLPDGMRAPEIGLPDEQGERVRMADLRGGPVVVTFLYSNCEDTCPLQAQQVKGALDDLGVDVPAIAISVDPEGDTERSARAFLSKQRMTGRMRFVLGSREQLRRIWDGYRIQPQRDDLEHTARVVLVDGRGLQRIGYPVGEITPERLAHDLQLLGAGS